MQNSSPVEKAQITGIFKSRGATGLLPEMKAFVPRYLDERTNNLAHTRGILEQIERELKEDLEAMEEFSCIPNPFLKILLAKLEL